MTPTEAGSCRSTSVLGRAERVAPGNLWPARWGSERLRGPRRSVRIREDVGGFHGEADPVAFDRNGGVTAEEGLCLGPAVPPGWTVLCRSLGRQSWQCHPRPSLRPINQRDEGRNPRPDDDRCWPTRGVSGPAPHLPMAMRLALGRSSGIAGSCPLYRSVSEKSEHAPSRPAPPARSGLNSCGQPAQSDVRSISGAVESAAAPAFARSRTYRGGCWLRRHDS
jgi:hypothetical protein